jgi:hypothetical protein
MTDERLEHRLFEAAAGRVAELELARCRDIELKALRHLRKRGPPAAMELLNQLKEQPVSDAWRTRAYQSLRRIYRQMMREGVDADTARVGMAAYVDGQPEMADRWLTMDVLVRPWGVP